MPQCGRQSKRPARKPVSNSFLQECAPEFVLRPTRYFTLRCLTQEKVPVPPHRIRLLICEPNRLYREGLAALLRELPDIKVVAAIAPIENIFTAARRYKADVVLWNAGLLQISSAANCGAVEKGRRAVKVIIIDALPTQENLLDQVRAGASGFVLRDATVADLLRTIRAVAEGDTIFPASLFQRLSFQNAKPTPSALQKTKKQGTESGRPNGEAGGRLTKRERELIQLITEDLNNKEIATALNLSTHTVKSHVHNILGKLGLEDRRQIACYAALNGYSEHPPASSPQNLPGFRAPR